MVFIHEPCHFYLFWVKWTHAGHHQFIQNLRLSTPHGSILFRLLVSNRWCKQKKSVIFVAMESFHIHCIIEHVSFVIYIKIELFRIHGAINSKLFLWFSFETELCKQLWSICMILNFRVILYTKDFDEHWNLEL